MYCFQKKKELRSSNYALNETQINIRQFTDHKINKYFYNMEK